MSTVALTEADVQAISSLPQRVVAAWASHDAESFADVFTEDGTMVLAGLYRNGRDEIRDYMAAAFQDIYKGTRVTGKPIGLRPLGADAAILFSHGGVIEAGDSDVSAAAAIRSAWIAVRDGQEWRLAAYQNTPANEPA
jgi:uncharacterized protein (TIGR02246 family)